MKGDVGYRYKVPATSYDVPFGSVGSLTNDRKYYHVGKQSFSTGSVVPVNPSQQLQTPIHEHTSFIGTGNLPQQQVSLSARGQENTNLLNNLHTPVHTEGISTFNIAGSSLNRNAGDVGTHNVALDSKSNFEGGNSHSVLINSKSQFETGNSQDVVLNSKSTFGQNVAVDSQSNFQAGHSQQVELQRHLYFYSAPEEPEEVRPRIVAPPAPAKKNVKVLFIKAPTFNSAPVHIPALPQNEEKTLVYVLVKKPEETSIVLPTPAPTKPSKPEVYFIKYKTQKEAQEAVSNLQQGGGHGGVSAISSDEFNANSFSNNVLSAGHHIEYEPNVELNRNINFVSKTSSSLNENGGIGSESPLVVSTLPTPTSFGESALHFTSGHSGLSNIVTPGFPHSMGQTHGERIFSSDGITNFDGSLNSRVNEFQGSTTVGSLNLPTAPTRFDGEVKVHQVYGPPSN